MAMTKLVVGLVVASLMGCTSVRDNQNGEEVAVVDEKAIDPVKTKESVDKQTAISPDVLYLLMAAEIAGQRNQYGVALDGYLQAAKKVNDPNIAERAAKIGLFLKDTKRTDEAVALWLSHDNKNLTARKIAVLSALRGTDRTKAVKHLEAMLGDDPAGFEATLVEVAKILEKEGNGQFVFEVLDDLAVEHQDQAVIFLVQALIAGQSKKFEIGEKKVKRTLVLQPDWDKALILESQFAIQGGDLVLAKTDLEKVLEKTPENTQIQKMLAQLLVKSNDFDAAIQMYRDILDNNPEDGDAQFSIALIYLQQKNEDEALEGFKKLVNKPVWDAPASFYIGRIEYNRKNYQQALVWFDKVTQGVYAFDASMASASVLISEKKYNEAEERIEKIEKSYPKQSTNIILLKSEVLNAQKKYKQAYDVLTKELKKHPENEELLYTRSLMAEKVDKLDVLEADLKKILAKNPNDANALNALGYTLVDRTQRYDEAEKYLTQAIKLKPEEAVILDSMGWLYFKQGKMEKSIRYLRKAYLKQSVGEIAAHLAEVLWHAGSKKEAKEVFEKAIVEFPDDDYLLKVQSLFLEE